MDIPFEQLRHDWSIIIVAFLGMVALLIFVSAILMRFYKLILRWFGIQAEEVEIEHSDLLKYVMQQKERMILQLLNRSKKMPKLPINLKLESEIMPTLARYARLRKNI